MDAWKYLPTKGIGPGMDKAKWPECDTNFDNAGPQLSGFNRPTRYQGEMRNLEVFGKKFLDPFRAHSTASCLSHTIFLS